VRRRCGEKLTKREKASLNSDTCSSVNESACHHHVNIAPMVPARRMRRMESRTAHHAMTSWRRGTVSVSMCRLAHHDVRRCVRRIGGGEVVVGRS
jgi:hypothetical protein